MGGVDIFGYRDTKLRLNMALLVKFFLGNVLLLSKSVFGLATKKRPDFFIAASLKKPVLVADVEHEHMILKTNPYCNSRILSMRLKI